MPVCGKPSAIALSVVVLRGLSLSLVIDGYVRCHHFHGSKCVSVKLRARHIEDEPPGASHGVSTCRNLQGSGLVLILPYKSTEVQCSPRSRPSHGESTR